MLPRHLVFLLAAAVAAAHDGPPDQCTWLPDNTSASKFTVTCRVRVLEETGNITTLPAEVTSRLRIACSDVLFFESTLPPQGFHRLHELEELTITNCKLLAIESGTFEGLYNLKKLQVNTFNAEWGPGKALELGGYSLDGLKELQALDLADNNIRAVPDAAFCSLSNLQTLNLTRNRIRNSERIGINVPECSGSEIKNLDLSHNDLRTLGENTGLSRLRRLQQLNLQFNNITEVSGEALVGLVSLRILDLSNNKIGTLPHGTFAGSPELKEIHLQNNSLFSLAKGLFHRLEQLLVLDLSGNQLTSNHIDAGTFTGLIRLIVLNLSHNALTRIDVRTFKDLYFLQILDLKNNSIGFIEDNAFLPLYNLHTLNLAENRLNTIGPQLFNGLFVLSKLTLNNNLIVNVDNSAFKNCSALKELDLSSNALSDVPGAIQELSFLKTLDLGENQITTFTNGSFRNLNQLTGLRLIDNNVGNLTKGMFWDLQSLQVLNLAKNKIQSIEKGTFNDNTQLEAIRLDENFISDINGVFATLASLLWLNLSENHLNWFDYAFIPSNLTWLDIHGNFIEHLGNYYKMQGEISVKTLDVSHNRITEITPMSIPNSVELLFINNNFIKTVQPNTFLDKTNLARVDMYANDLVSLDLNALRIAMVPPKRALPEVYIGGNPFRCDCSMEWLQLINNMSTSRQYPKVMDLENVICKMTHSRGMTHMPLSRAKPSDFLCTYETHCFALCHCCDFDACDCEMTCPYNCSCYHDQTWNTNVVDCSGQGASELPQKIPMDATEVYLDGNDIKELQKHAFIGRKNMRVLYVNNSQVESIQNSTFNGLQTLRVLHLEGNKLRRLQGAEFDQLAGLKELYLQENLLEYIDNRTLAPLVSLEVLRLDGNRLAVFPVWSLARHKRLAEVTLSGNPWSCRCKFLRGLAAWVGEHGALVADAAALQCAPEGGGRRHPLSLNGSTTAACGEWRAMEGAPSDHWPAVAATLGVAALLLIGAALALACRGPARVWLRARLCSKPPRDARPFDAFVAYSAKDEEWVARALVAELEPSLQLCLQHRDLPGAAPRALLEAADASRKVVLVLTRNYLQTEWARFELRQALHEALKGRRLLVLEEAALLEAERDPELRPYLRTAERVCWTDRRFRQRLKRALPATSGASVKLGARAGGNTYTLEGARAPPPAYAPPLDAEDAAYSSAATATPSPRPARPASDHIYSSIDSDYSTLERAAQAAGRRAPPWHPRPPPPAAHGHAYLV